MDYAYITKPGTRNYNEDSAMFLEKEGAHLFVVADGLGGHGKGEVASAIAVETFKESFENGDIVAESFLAETFSKAQENILKEQKIQNATMEMKTTCVSILVENEYVKIGHIGDSRAYVFKKNKVKTRTLDHSVPQMLAISGSIKEKQIRNHPDRNRLLRVMGVQWDTPRYEIAEPLSLTDCQGFLLCTDGFWELCTEKKMCTFLKKSKNAKEWIDMMVEEIERNGTNIDMDNFTAIAVIC